MKKTLPSIRTIKARSMHITILFIVISFITLNSCIEDDPIDPSGEKPAVVVFDKTLIADKEFFVVKEDKVDINGDQNIKVVDTDTAIWIAISPIKENEKFIRVELNDDKTDVYISGNQNKVEVAGFTPGSGQYLEFDAPVESKKVIEENGNIYYKIVVSESDNTIVMVVLGESDEISQEQIDDAIEKIDEQIWDAKTA